MHDFEKTIEDHWSPPWSSATVTQHHAAFDAWRQGFHATKPAGTG